MLTNNLVTCPEIWVAIDEISKKLYGKYKPLSLSVKLTGILTSPFKFSLQPTIPPPIPVKLPVSVSHVTSSIGHKLF